MGRRISCLLLLSTMLCGCFPERESERPPISDLKLVAVYPLDSPEKLEPSGLVQTPEGLLTVADKVETTVYRVELDNTRARLVPYLRFKSAGPRFPDWEGITADNTGNLYLISESYGRILKVQSDGSSSWLTTDLRIEGRKKGLFTRENAGFEGITLVKEGYWLGAVEREPRGLVALEKDTDPPRITAWQQMQSPFMNTLPIHRLPDYSGLDTSNGQVFALFRNAHLVVRLNYDGKDWREVEAWSYRHIETDPRWAYTFQTYGQAEGLAIDGQDVYIILDNNRGPRRADVNDRRPILIHARFPNPP